MICINLAALHPEWGLQIKGQGKTFKNQGRQVVEVLRNATPLPNFAPSEERGDAEEV